MRRNGSGVLRATRIVPALCLALAWTSPHAQRAGQIDGSGAESFERSVVALQNDLSPRRRDDFETALAVLWMTRTQTADFDRDGDVDLQDVRQLEEETWSLLTEIRQGDVVAAVESRAPNEHTAADFYRQLDGLEYGAVIDLADRPEAEGYRNAARQVEARGPGGRSPAQGSTSRVAAPDWPTGNVIDAKTGVTLNAAIEAYNAQDYAAAKAALATLKLDRLSPFERSKVEQIWFSIALRERDYAEAREHLLQALAAGGLNAQETAEALTTIQRLDAQLARDAR